MNAISLNIPDNWKLTDFQLKMLFASMLLKENKVTKDEAVEIVGCTKEEFEGELENVRDYSLVDKPSLK